MACPASAFVLLGMSPSSDLARRAAATRRLAIELDYTASRGHKEGLMADPPNDYDAIRRAAQRGARSATRKRQCQQDGVAAALDRWEDALLRGRAILDPERWAYRVAANEARSLAARAPSRRELDPAGALGEIDKQLNRLLHEDADRAEIRTTRSRVIRALLARRRKTLRGRQLEVVMILARPGMTFHRAAKELAMPRFNVKRSFRSALRRLAQRSK
jgi:DNA-directed RNA polymerase specialized sigma24 family protein